MLLILAGVTIALVVGDNGILNQAVNAADETNRANAQTELEMAVSAVVADWSSARYLEGNKQTLEEYLTQGRVESNMNIDDYTIISFILNTDKGVTVQYRGKDYKFTVEITSSGNSAKVTYSEKNDSISSGDDTPEEPEDQITYEFGDVESYGDFVNYPVDINNNQDTTDDWKIFYSENGRIFIITADYVPNDSEYLNNEAIGTTTVNDYALYWESVPSSQTVSQATLDLFKQSWDDYSTHTSGKCASTLLNTSNWSNFVNETYSDFAIGGPTLEMWVASYNSNGYTPLFINTDSYGYYIGLTEKTTNLTQYITSDTEGIEISGHDDKLYFPYKEIKDNCEGYWISSPHATVSIGLKSIYVRGDIQGANSVSNFSLGLRPLVSLKTTVTATYGNGVWNLSNT